MSSPKILLYDLETSLETAAIFALKDNDWIDPSNLLTERYVICASWKWLGEGEVHSVSVLDDVKRYAANPHDDRHVVETLHAIMQTADVIIAHNGDGFDKRYLDTRSLQLGLDPLPPITSIDTYKIAKQKFLFNSNSLNYIAKYLGLGEKIQTSKGLWLRVLNGDAKAIVDMEIYNRQDVVLLEAVFNRLRPYCPAHVNRELFGVADGLACPRCGSTNVQSRGVHRAITKTYQRFQCQNDGCRGWFRRLRGEKGTTPHRVL